MVLLDYVIIIFCQALLDENLDMMWKNEKLAMNSYLLDPCET